MPPRPRAVSETRAASPALTGAAPTGTPMDVASATTSLEERAHAVGRALAAALGAALASVPEARQGPQALALALGLDKVLTSRTLKALAQGDPIAVLHAAPGPEPLRRLVRAARRRGATVEATAAAEASILAFEEFIRRDAGDRSALGAMLSAWLPEARAEFELRRKQSAYRALSELKGASMELNVSTTFLAPAADGVHLDVVWVNSFLGIARHVPRAAVRFTSRRLGVAPSARRPMTLDGAPVEDLAGVRLDDFCVAPPAAVDVQRAGDVIHYVLGSTAYGPAARCDLVFAEVNRAELPRAVPRGSGRKGYVYADIAVPAKALVLDVFVHVDVYPGAEPELFVYDTAIGGIADVNDRSRDFDRLELLESVEARGPGQVRLAEAPRYGDLVRHVHGRLGWDPAQFRHYRVRVEYPVYGSQVVLAFRAPEL
jgi:hypothetical protein